MRTAIVAGGASFISRHMADLRRDASLRTPETIQGATRTWFQYLADRSA